jgi:hypothetical protein
MMNRIRHFKRKGSGTSIDQDPKSILNSEIVTLQAAIVLARFSSVPLPTVYITVPASQKMPHYVPRKLYPSRQKRPASPNELPHVEYGTVYSKFYFCLLRAGRTTPGLARCGSAARHRVRLFRLVDR